ncbi:O-succinylbenzoic acid--CoA ligase [Altererythrobacter epoxidivorans]|uniref:3-methylmercaptopropionyl-CoA ligase n=1 Tax=Altererythrobacter epoxidivorans TaxID=361183 RepID=A0A0M4M520_9SPHN|nr:long-chain-fatty-acid--CoA ligase [Altererythrobacter epoxidivorans]ALE17028.1 O-succinylbenzoic acid--CoA ligase [Altererythrobacter epoxidivorans]
MTDQHTYLTYDEVIRHWAKHRPENIATEQDDRKLTYTDLLELTDRAVGYFQSAGVAKGDRIAWLGKNSDLYAILFAAAARMGVVMAPIGWRLAPPEIAYIVKDTGSKILFAGEEFAETARTVAYGIDPRPAVLSEGEAWKAVRTSDRAEFDAAGPDDGILQLYTSGTTGNPKGVVLTGRNLLGLRPFGIAEELPWAEYRPTDCVLVAMPIAHIGGTGLINISFASGVRALIQAEFTPEGVLDGIESGVTQMFIVPAALQMVIQHPKAATTDFSNLRYLMYGAAPIPLELLREAVKTMPTTGFLQAYGMTETTGTIASLPPDDHTLEGNKRMRSAGKAVPGTEIAILGPDGKEVPRGEIGEIAVRSPSNTSGYWKLPEATAATIDKDGWLHTGDAAYMDDDGYLYIQDRIKDMIISGGENVYPAEVESAIYGHPAIAEVAVIGIPSEKWGEEVKACVVAKPGMEVDPNDVIAWARERVAAFKAPKTVDVIPEMPRNPSGKILRRELRAPFWEGQERQVS